MSTLTRRIRDADPDIQGTEAAWTVLEAAFDADDAHMLLDALDLAGVAWRWDLARAARVAVTRARFGAVFSANTLRGWLPDRAQHLVAGAMKSLTTTGLIAPTGQVVQSTAPRARGSLVRCYKLTRAGEELAGELGGIPGETAVRVSELITMGGGAEK